MKTDKKNASVNGSIFMLWIAIFLFTGCGQPTSKTKNENVSSIVGEWKGVKTKIDYEIDYRSRDSSLIKKKMVLKSSYDEEGRLCEAVFYDENENYAGMEVYVHDSNGNVISYMGIGPDSLEMYNLLTTYNDQNLEVEAIWYFPDGTYKYRKPCMYNDKNELIEKRYIWMGDVLKGVNRYAYDAASRMISDSAFQPDGNLSYHRKFTYDEAGNLIDEIQCDPENNVVQHQVYVFDKDGNKINLTNYFTDGTVDYKDEYRYDENGKLIWEQRTSRLSGIMYSNTHVYNDRGFLSKTIRNNFKGVIEKELVYEYSYY